MSRTGPVNILAKSGDRGQITRLRLLAGTNSGRLTRPRLR